MSVVIKLLLCNNTRDYFCNLLETLNPLFLTKVSSIGWSAPSTKQDIERSSVACHAHIVLTVFARIFFEQHTQGPCTVFLGKFKKVGFLAGWLVWAADNIPLVQHFSLVSSKLSNVDNPVASDSTILLFDMRCFLFNAFCVGKLHRAGAYNLFERKQPHTFQLTLQLQ